MAGDEETLASLWERLTTEVDDLVAQRERGVSSVEDFAVDRACDLLDRLRQRAIPDETPEPKTGPITLRSMIAMGQHRNRVLQDMIEEAQASLGEVHNTRKMLEKTFQEQEQKKRLKVSRPEVQRHLNDQRNWILAAQDELLQLEREKAALAAERQRVEQLIMEANQRKAQGITNGEPEKEDQTDAQNLDNMNTQSNAMQIEAVAAGGTSENPASTTAAFLSSSLGLGVDRGKLELGTGSFLSSDLQYLVSQRPERHLADEAQTTAEVASFTSSSLNQGYTPTKDLFEDIQERLRGLREICSDPDKAGIARTPCEPGVPSPKQARVIAEAEAVLHKLEIVAGLRDSLN